MNFYYRIRRTSTVITAGSSWLSTFEGATASYIPTLGGEIHVNGSAQSVCADIGIQLANTTTLTIYTEAGVGSEVQIHYNGTYTELSASGSTTITLNDGPTQFAVIAKAGAIIFEAFLFGLDTSIIPISLYAQGQDPVMGGSSSTESPTTPPFIPH